MAQATPIGLARLSLPGYRVRPVHTLIQTVFMHAVAACLQPDNRELDRWRRIILSLPPRTGKSEITSVNGPAWALGNWPQLNVGVVSYEATFAEGFGAMARNVLSVFGPAVFNTTTDPSSEAKDWWGTANATTKQVYRGGMKAMGIGGPMVGKGFNLLNIDDPVKNAEEALSVTMRERNKNWWQAAAKRALEPGGVAIITQQRWHEDDLAGYVMREEGLYDQGGEWTPIIVPLAAEWITAQHAPGLLEPLPDPLGRADGELLDTGRFSAVEMAKRKAGTPSFWWDAQYQQRPASKAGTLFKRENFRYWEETPSYYKLRRSDVTLLVEKGHLRIFGIVDLAASLREAADYFTAGVYGIAPNGAVLLLHMIRAKYEGPDQDEVIETLWRSWSRQGMTHIGIESTGYQLTFVQRMRRKGIPIREVAAKGDKFGRAITSSTMMQGEQFFIPAQPIFSGTTRNELESEHLNFPNAAHDDMVDNVAYACIHVSQGGGGVNMREVG